MHIIQKLKDRFCSCRKNADPAATEKSGEQLTVRGRMAYGLSCLASYFRHHNIDWLTYKDEIELLAAFTSSDNLPQWEQDARRFLFSKYSDEQCKEGIPHLLELLYYVGVGDMYGKYQGASSAELYSITEILRDENIPLPDIGMFSDFLLTSPVHDSDYYGALFRCPEYFA